MSVRADVTEPGAADELFDAVEDELGPVLCLVNNAGVRADALSPQIDDEQWSTVVETNLSAAFRITRRALRRMMRARFGRIVNVASVVGQRANPGQANYAASKAGLIAMTRTIAAEVARRGVTVNAVAPGLVATEMTEGVGDELLKAVPARRAGTPEEVAACVRFLASAEAALRERNDPDRRRRADRLKGENEMSTTVTKETDRGAPDRGARRVRRRARPDPPRRRLGGARRRLARPGRAGPDRRGRVRRPDASEEELQKIDTVGQAIDFVAERAGP